MSTLEVDDPDHLGYGTQNPEAAQSGVVFISDFLLQVCHIYSKIF